MIFRTAAFLGLILATGLVLQYSLRVELITALIAFVYLVMCVSENAPTSAESLSTVAESLSTVAKR